MISYFPKTIANKGLVIYLASLVLVSVVFMNHAMDVVWFVLGVLEVSLFFLVSNNLTKKWERLNPKWFVRNVFWFAFLLRTIWVIFSYYFYSYKTGIPFEYGAADSIAYHGDAEWLAREPWVTTWNYLFVDRASYSDTGYCLYLTFLYKILGPNVFIARIVKAIWGSVLCVLLYKFTARVVNENVGKMAAIFAMLMPNLIIYCGLHLKETEMLLLIVLFLERADYAIRSRKITLWNVIVPVLIAGTLFLFRTVLGVVTLFSFLTALLFSPNHMMKKGRRVALTLWVVAGVMVLAGGTVMNEVEELWMNRYANQDSRRMEQETRGIQWAKYATGTVMAPMVFVLPFSTMVDTDQENQTMLHGGNYVRNFMGVFVLISFFSALFYKKNWRDFALIGSFVIGYLFVISMSGFSNSERFLLPGLPCLIIFWAYGLSVLNAKSYRFVKIWYFVVPIMEIGWAFFKIGSRGLL
ncbi:MAG: glycosyltransferase family 39 protein [Bacteroidales bacterium]|nr:glycosyltransferase family 39 protein [Bacteroidales bacterium]